jgi:hypothetical protein
VKKNSLLLLILFLSNSIFAERYSLKTELDQVNFLDQLLNTSENLRLQVIDDFETNQYYVYDPPTPLHQLEVVYKNPRLSFIKEQKRAFELEENYPDKFFLVFKVGSREIKIFVAELNWNGWKRIENQLPKNFTYLPKLNKPPYYYQFRGFFIQTTNNTTVGNREILLDHLLILSNTQKLQYSGSEILDNF